MTNLIQEWIGDLNEKIDFLHQHPANVEHYMWDGITEEEEKSVIESAKKSVQRRNEEDKKREEYFKEMIEKVKQLKQNPTTDNEKKAWIELMDELHSDFDFHHDCRNESMGQAGGLLLRCLFDKEVKEDNSEEPDILIGTPIDEEEK